MAGTRIPLAGRCLCRRSGWGGVLEHLINQYLVCPWQHLLEFALQVEVIEAPGSGGFVASFTFLGGGGVASAVD